ncbi:ABC transporter ATP-binding protein [Thermus tengchongensis]|uniref:ABC transporter ATP-binding protein n=1 Tax=Thermus tengchongensis TaxID=1214928 RepID=UPI001F32D3F2|nr:ATP-binding cassette domain-containing protein [Thermus tengchongensis]
MEGAPPLLEALDLHIRFGGVVAAAGISLQVYPGELLAIIGPNGAGKTTFLNLCTGYLRPERGRVLLEGKEITGLPPRAIARMGVARAFQIPQLFTEHTVEENLLLALAARKGFWKWSYLRDDSRRQRARDLLALLGLENLISVPVAEAPEGVRKLLDVAMALALEPKLLLLDEPTSGVSSEEKFRVMDTLVRALKTQGVTTVFVEHDMEVVRRYADRVAVWAEGRILAEGKPQEVLANPKVLASVVGVEE